MKSFISLLVMFVALTSPLLGQTQQTCQPKDYCKRRRLAVLTRRVSATLE